MTSRSNRYNNKTVIIASLVFWGTVLIAIVVTVIVLTGRNIDQPVRHHTTPEPSVPAPMIESTESFTVARNATNSPENVDLFDSMVVDPDEKPS
jgi:flagellar basal body-associated protein FliL